MHDLVGHGEPPGLDPVRASSTADVCTVRWGDAGCNLTALRSSFTSYAMPRGARHFTNVTFPRRGLNPELGVSHTWLPVSHTHTTQHAWQPGLWFYYMRGCSDFMWDMGRTLLVRNRCHLAIALEQRVHRISWSHAAYRVAQRLALATNVSAWAPDIAANPTGGAAMVVRPLEGIVGSNTDGKQHNVSELATALSWCARGLIHDLKAQRIERLLLTLNTLDYLSASVLQHSLGGTADELDTIQIANQCSSSSSEEALADGICGQATEIWDVRALSKNLSNASDMPRPWRDASGTRCDLADFWPLCMACNESLSARACRFKCSQASHGHHSQFAPQGRLVKEISYGKPLSAGYLKTLHTRGALGKATAWQWVWQKVVGRLPQVESDKGGSRRGKHRHQSSDGQ